MPWTKGLFFFPRNAFGKRCFLKVFFKTLQKPAIESYPPAGGPRLQKFFTLFMAYTDEKEGPISISAYSSLRHVPKRSFT
jgi:hypothetical protein